MSGETGHKHENYFHLLQKTAAFNFFIHPGLSTDFKKHLLELYYRF